MASWSQQLCHFWLCFYWFPFFPGCMSHFPWFFPPMSHNCLSYVAYLDAMFLRCRFLWFSFERCWDVIVGVGFFFLASLIPPRLVLRACQDETHGMWRSFLLKTAFLELQWNAWVSHHLFPLWLVRTPWKPPVCDLCDLHSALGSPGGSLCSVPCTITLLWDLAQGSWESNIENPGLWSFHLGFSILYCVGPHFPSVVLPWGPEFM